MVFFDASKYGFGMVDKQLTVSLTTSLDSLTRVLMQSPVHRYNMNRSIPDYENRLHVLQMWFLTNDKRIPGTDHEAGLQGAHGIGQVRPCIKIFSGGQISETKSMNYIECFIQEIVQNRALRNNNLLEFALDASVCFRLLAGGAVLVSVKLPTDNLLQTGEGTWKWRLLGLGHWYTAHVIVCAESVKCPLLYNYLWRNRNKKREWNEGFLRKASGRNDLRRAIVRQTVWASEPQGAHERQTKKCANKITKWPKVETAFAPPLDNMIYIMWLALSSEPGWKIVMKMQQSRLLNFWLDSSQGTGWLAWMWSYDKSKTLHIFKNCLKQMLSHALKGFTITLPRYSNAFLIVIESNKK